MRVERARLRQTVPLREFWMSAARAAAIALGVCAALSCSSAHSDRPDPGPADGGNAAGGHAADRCQISATVPRVFPTDGPCDDTEPVHETINGVPTGHYSVTCDPQPL